LNTVTIDVGHIDNDCNRGDDRLHGALRIQVSIFETIGLQAVRAGRVQGVLEGEMQGVWTGGM
jgi:hypothetical protein